MINKFIKPIPPLSKIIYEGHTCICNSCGSTLKHKFIIFCSNVKQKKGCFQEGCINYYLIKIYSMEIRKLWIENVRLFREVD